MRLPARRPRRTSTGPQDLATDEDIVAAYRLILKRDPDPSGFEHFRQLVRCGLTLDQLVFAFLNSDEYVRSVAQDTAVNAVDLGGYYVCTRLSEKDFGVYIIRDRQYEPHVCKALSELLREGQTFVDIGANVGCISLLAAKLVGPRGTVIAVEPNPDNLQLLYAGIARNGYSNVRVLPYAASDRREIFTLTGGTSNTHLVASREPGSHEFYTQSVLLDEELAALPGIDVVKIDIEGHEPFALRGFWTLLLQHNPILITEFNPLTLERWEGINPIDYLRQLFSHFSSLHVITVFGDSVTFTAPGDLWAYWQKRDAEISAQHLLREGFLTFDVICRT